MAVSLPVFPTSTAALPAFLSRPDLQRGDPGPPEPVLGAPGAAGGRQGQHPDCGHDGGLHLKRPGGERRRPRPAEVTRPSRSSSPQSRTQPQGRPSAEGGHPRPSPSGPGSGSAQHSQQPQSLRGVPGPVPPPCCSCAEGKLWASLQPCLLSAPGLSPATHADTALGWAPLRKLPGLLPPGRLGPRGRHRSWAGGLAQRGGEPPAYSAARAIRRPHPAGRAHSRCSAEAPGCICTGL